jgi:hypothetical protein
VNYSPRGGDVEGVAAGLQVLSVGENDRDIMAEARFEEQAEVREPSA